MKALNADNRLIIILSLAALCGLGFFLIRNFKGGKQVQEVTERDELISRGIHPDPVEIQVLEDVTALWQDDEVAYSLEKMYFTPDIANLGNFRNNERILDKSFLIAEISVRDRRTDGERRKIIVHDYLRLREGKSDEAPLSSDNPALYPQETGMAYVTFPVDPNSSQFKLLIGILSRPRVIDLDFDKDSVLKKEGVFILGKGYFPEYPSDLQ